MSLDSLDISILLDFLQPQADNDFQSTISAQLASLETLTSMCSNSEMVDCLRQQEGLKLIWNLCRSSTDINVTHACFLALACIAQGNVYAQQELCLEHVFASVHHLLEADDLPLKTLNFVTYFLLSLVSKNKQGQDNISSSGCLDTLMKLFSKCSSKVISDGPDANDYVELWKVVMKTLNYSVNSPQNDENQVKLCAILPIVVNMVHNGKENRELTRLSCALMSVIVENNLECQRAALEVRVVEVLILLLNYLLQFDENECLGDAVTALSHVLPLEEDKYWRKFLSFGGSSILIKLIDKEPTDYWLSYHISKVLSLLERCIEISSTEFDIKNYPIIAKKIVKLMEWMADDEYFNKMAVSLLNFFIATDQCKSNERSHKCINVETSVSEKKEQLSLHSHQACSTILLNTEHSRMGEVMLDISNTSREALWASSGICESPTDNIFTSPQLPKKFKSQNGICWMKTKKPSVDHFENHNNLKEKMLPPLSQSHRNSTPKPKKSHKSKPHARNNERKFRRMSKHADSSSIITMCGDLIEEEVQRSIKRDRYKFNSGNSGLLSHSFK